MVEELVGVCVQDECVCMVSDNVLLTDLKCGSDEMEVQR